MKGWVVVAAIVIALLIFAGYIALNTARLTGYR